MAQNRNQAATGESVGAVGRFQVVEKREDKNLRSIEVLIKGNIEGKDFVSYNERTLHGLCEDYRMIEAVSSGLLKVSEYHHCQKDHEDFEEDREDYKWAYVETEDAGRVIGSVGSLADFNKIYATLYECIDNGWGKTVRCELEKNGAIPSMNATSDRDHAAGAAGAQA